MNENEDRLRPVSVIGYSNTGKTAFVETLVARLAERGTPVLVVKVSRHPGQFDSPGRDTDRFRKAGAAAVAYRGPDRWVVQAQTVPLEDADDGVKMPAWVQAMRREIGAVLIVEGRIVPGAVVVQTVGEVGLPGEGPANPAGLKYPVDRCDFVVSGSETIPAVVEETIRRMWNAREGNTTKNAGA